MTKIAEEREYIVDVSQMHKKLSERFMDEMLGIELNSAILEERNGKLTEFVRLFKIGGTENKKDERVEITMINSDERGLKCDNVAIVESR